MFDGVGVETIGGILVVILGGKLTPLDCYVGLGSGTGDGVELVEPVGSLGCEYDADRLRFFVEHLSSPADPGDNPGFNHVGVKYLFPVAPFNAYLGGSYAPPSEQNNMGPVIGIIGIETDTQDVRFFAEHLQSVTNGESVTWGGVKFIF